MYELSHKTPLWCQTQRKLSMWGNNDGCSRTLGSSSLGACLAGEGEKNGGPLLLAALHHASACSSGHPLLLLDSCLQMLLRIIFLAPYSRLAPILLLKDSVDSPHLRTHSFFWPFLADWPMWVCKLVPTLSSHPAPMPGAQKSWPPTIQSRILSTTELAITLRIWNNYRSRISQFIQSWAGHGSRYD